MSERSEAEILETLCCELCTPPQNGAISILWQQFWLKNTRTGTIMELICSLQNGLDHDMKVQDNLWNNLHFDNQGILSGLQYDLGHDVIKVKYEIHVTSHFDKQITLRP